MALADYVGYIAAVCTTSAYAPQVLKVWRTRSTQDISLKAFVVLVTGQSLWLLYGVFQNDWPLILSNAVTITFTGTILWFKCRSGRCAETTQESSPSIASTGTT